MKNTLKDATDLRVYHLGLRPGEVANRIVTVGSPSRARIIAKFLDETPKPFTLESERGFLTITGRYKGTPITVLSIGMGAPNMDFFVREVRECLSGDMLVVRLGSCGCLINAPVGTVVVPKACVAVTRNVDFDFLNPEASQEPPYRISKLVYGDTELHAQLKQSLEAAKPNNSETQILADIVNASADSFYSSQGRQTAFPDHNEHVIEDLLKVPDVVTLEMETHHLYHLAACWGRRIGAQQALTAPLTTSPVLPTSTPSHATATLEPTAPLASPDAKIRVSAAQMIFAARSSRDFITPEQVNELEHWTGKVGTGSYPMSMTTQLDAFFVIQGVLEALCQMTIPLDKQHPEQGSVWETL
uniref:Nucleoside phosphorylase domain-containing protein n=1 Tax=Moniliophthora roreri TaxID=221103 RepID=A0A0W0F9X7_MONRR